MKKILFAIALVLMIGFGASAQFDNFVLWEDDEYREFDEFGFVLPSSHGSLTNTEAPLGNGLLIIGAMGIGYAVIRKKK